MNIVQSGLFDLLMTMLVWAVIVVAVIWMAFKVGDIWDAISTIYKGWRR